MVIAGPYLLFLGAQNDPAYAKTAYGLADWAPERCAGQLRLDGCGLDLGVQDMSIPEAKDAGVRTLVVGVAPIGGAIEAAWLPVFEEALANGLDIASGLHQRLNDNRKLSAAAERLKRNLIDVRVPPEDIPIAKGGKRSGQRVLTVGVDCAVGKKYTALCLWKEVQARGLPADFRATGQTGIMITGSGVPMDAVISDFLAGAAEILSPSAAQDHWDIIEGQGSLFHPAYAGVALGLLHGSQPDAIVVCHDAARQHISGYPAYPLPTIEDCIERNLQAARLTNHNVRCIGVSVNTSSITDDGQALDYCQAIGARLGLPVVDPMRHGVSPLADKLLIC